MYFANPWGLLALLAIPAILVIHLFQQRFPPLMVAGAHLWGIETRVPTAGRRRDRLPVSATLLLELLAALMLATALSEPHFHSDDQVVHIVAVLDDSASMLARSDGETSPRDLAVAELQRRAESTSASTAFTLIRTGTQPTLVGRRGMSWSETQEALAQWLPRATQHDFAAAWDEALQVAGDNQGFLFLTDSLPDAAASPQSMEVLALGERCNNQAISTARWTFDSDEGRGTLFFRIVNYVSEPATVRVTARAGQQTLVDEWIELTADGDRPLQYAIPGGVGELTLEMESATDCLEVDNHASLIEPKVRMLTLASLFADDSPAGRVVERVFATFPDSQLGPPERAHLLTGPASSRPPPVAGQWWLGIGPLVDTEAARDASIAVRGPFILDKQHPLLDGVTLGGVLWAGIQPTDEPLIPLVTCNRQPLFAQYAVDSPAAFLLNIDLGRSNLSRTPDWPILLTNLLELRRSEIPGLRRWNYRTNEIVTFRAPPVVDDEELKLVSLSGERKLIRDRRDEVQILGLAEPGVHAVKIGDRVWDRFAVNFVDPLESDLRSMTPGRRVPEDAGEPTRISIDNPYSWLIVAAVLLALAAVLWDWHTLRGRPKQTDGSATT